MKRIVAYAFLLASVLAPGAADVAAQVPAAPAAAAAPTSGARAEFLNNLDGAADHLLRLAEAIPAEKYTWRPGPEVRSVSEVFLHVAGGNFGIPRRVGRAVPEGIQLGPNFDKSATDKAAVIDLLKRSLENVRQAAINLADTDLEKTTQWFGGRQATYREVLFFLASHNHEHLGQAIAYARINGVVPPWTEEQQQRQRQQQPAKPPG